MGDLVIVQHPPWGERDVKPILQWGHVSDLTPHVKLVRLMGGGQTHTSQACEVTLDPGTPVLLQPGAERAVVVSHAGGKYRVRTRQGTLDAQAATAMWPDPEPWPLPDGFSGPVAAFTAGLRTPSAQRAALRWSARRYLATATGDGLSGASWIDADLLPHQIAAVQKVLASPSVAHLLADEVGLGKTVEALLIWSALQAKTKTLRTLVVTPRGLVPQWAFEIQRRATRGIGRWHEGLPRVFVADEEGAFEAFDAPDLSRPVVTEFSALETSTVPPDWVELLIIDEVHSLTRLQRVGAERLIRSARHTLLLTATPRRSRRVYGAAADRSSGDVAAFSWALANIDPRFNGDLGSAERAVQAVGTVAPMAADALDGNIAAIDELRSLINKERERVELAPLDGKVGVERLVQYAARQIAPYARVVRTLRRDVSLGLGRRELHEKAIDYRQEEIHLLRKLGAWFEDAVETGETGASGAKRRAASSWAALSDGAPVVIRTALTGVGRADSRMEALLELLASIWSENRNRRVLIRAEYAETRAAVSERLRALLEDGALRESTDAEVDRWCRDDIGPVALVQASQESLVDTLRRLSETGGQDDGSVGLEGTIFANLEAFDEGGALVLVADATAEVGLNLQGASDLIFMDIPWSPRAMEQWIGRLDRLGRRDHEPVRIHVFTHSDSPDRPLIDLYRELGVFDQGFHVPPEVAEEVDGLIAKADRNQLPWRKAIESARILAADQSALERDVLLDSLAPDQDRGQRALARAIGESSGGSEESREFFDALASNGFEVAHPDDFRVEVALGNARLALRDVRERLLPRKQGKNLPRKDPKPLEIPFRRSDLSERLGRGRRLLFTPRHPLFKEAWEELQLEAGASVGTFKAQCPGALPELRNKWVAMLLCETKPSAQGEVALWQLSLDDGGSHELRTCADSVSDAVGRILSVLYPPSCATLAYSLHVEDDVAQLDQPLDGKWHGQLRDTLRGASEQGVPKWVEAVLSRCQGAVGSRGAPFDDTGVSEPINCVKDFIADRRQALLSNAAQVVEDRQKLVTSTGGTNPGFVAQLGKARRDLDTARAFFEGLGALNFASADLAAAANRFSLAEAAFVFLEG